VPSSDFVVSCRSAVGPSSSETNLASVAASLASRVGVPPLDKPFPGDVLDRDAILREVPRNRKRPRCLAMGEKVIFMSPCLFCMDTH
jgi:hypothetical protein